MTNNTVDKWLEEFEKKYSGYVELKMQDDLKRFIKSLLAQVRKEEREKIGRKKIVKNYPCKYCPVKLKNEMGFLKHAGTIHAYEFTDYKRKAKIEQIK